MSREEFWEKMRSPALNDRNCGNCKNGSRAYYPTGTTNGKVAVTLRGPVFCNGQAICYGNEWQYWEWNGE